MNKIKRLKCRDCNAQPTHLVNGNYYCKRHMHRPEIVKVFLIHSHGCGSDKVNRYDTDIVIRVKGTSEFGKYDTAKTILNKLQKMRLFKGVKFEKHAR